jgi:hypothetical protein
MKMISQFKRFFSWTVQSECNGITNSFLIAFSVGSEKWH